MSSSSLPNSTMLLRVSLATLSLFSPLALLFGFSLFIFKDLNWEPDSPVVYVPICTHWHMPICILAAVLGQRMPRLLAQVGQVSATTGMWPSTLGAPVRSHSLTSSLCGDNMYLGLQLQMGKLPSLIKLLHKAVFWDWHTQISEHELSKSLPLFLFLNVFSSRRLKLQLEMPPSFGSRAFYKWHPHRQDD